MRDLDTSTRTVGKRTRRAKLETQRRRQIRVLKYGEMAR